MSTKKEAILQDKSNMLDEVRTLLVINLAVFYSLVQSREQVNKLLDLMDMEKNSLHQKIAQLEVSELLYL